MIFAAWVLVIFMKWGYSGGAVTIEYSTKETCQQAANVTKASQSSVRAAFCVERR